MHTGRTLMFLASFLSLVQWKAHAVRLALDEAFSPFVDSLPIVTLVHVVQIVQYMASPIAKTFMFKFLGPRAGHQIESSAVVSPTILVYLRKIEK